MRASTMGTNVTPCATIVSSAHIGTTFAQRMKGVQEVVRLANTTINDH